MILFLLSFLWLPFGYVAMRIMVDGSFCCLGKHHWSSVYHSSDIDMVTNTVHPISLSWECGHCHTKKTIKPGSRAWEKHWMRVEDNMREEPWQQHRYGQLLGMGREIDIMTGEPVEQ